MTDNILLEEHEQIVNMHYSADVSTPIRADAFALTDGEKIMGIAHHFVAIMDIIDVDLTDDSLSGPPHRVAKMYIEEIFSGLKPKNNPSISTFDNKYQYGKLLVGSGSDFVSACEHSTTSMMYGGCFEQGSCRQEFFNLLKSKTYDSF